MRKALAAFAALALVSGMVVWQEPLRATTARRKAAPSFFRSFHASFQGASVTTTGSGGVTRHDGQASLQSFSVPGSTVVLQGAPAAHFTKLNQEGASLSLFAFQSGGPAPASPSAVARVTAGGSSLGVSRGFGFKWSMGQLFGFTIDTFGTENECKLGPAGENDLLALIGPSDVEFYVDGTAMGSLPIPSHTGGWVNGNIYEISVTNGTMAQNYGFTFHSLKIETPH